LNLYATRRRSALMKRASALHVLCRLYSRARGQVDRSLSSSRY